MNYIYFNRKLSTTTIKTLILTKTFGLLGLNDNVLEERIERVSIFESETLVVAYPLPLVR